MNEITDLGSFQRLLQGRHSCRAFLPQEVPRETIERILETAQKTASWCNTQPWQLVITSGAGTERFRQALLERVKKGDDRPDFEYPREYTGVYRDRRRRCGMQLYDSVDIDVGDRTASAAQAMHNFRFFKAPHVAIITAPESLGVYGAVDCGAYVSNFLLAAHGLGIATIAQASLALQAPFIHSFFDIDESRKIVCGIAFGYEDVRHPVNGFRTDRAGLEEVVRWVVA